jgi:hypothetical protein
MTKLLHGVSPEELSAFIARYGVPPVISGGSPGEGGEGGEGAGDGDGGGDEGSQDDAAAKALKAERKRAEDAEKRLKAIEDRDKSELQKATERAEKAERDAAEASARARDLTAKDLVQAAATEAGGKRPGAIYELVKGKLDFNDKGEITNVKDVIAQAKKDVPELFGISTQGNPGNGSGDKSSPVDMNALLRQGRGR